MSPPDGPSTSSGASAAGSGATVAYTDGACRGNPGPGGWAWAVPGGRWESGYEEDSTNQRMEIVAAWRAVEALDGPVHIVSDSTYVVNCFRDEWWQGWMKRGWKNSKKEPVANRDLWEPFIELVRSRDVTFDWVKGHSGDPMNDVVDRLAVAASHAGHGSSGDTPPSDDDLAAPDSRPGAAASVPVGGSDGSDAAAADRVTAARGRDRRVPEGTPYAVVGLRSPTLETSEAGAVLRRQLAAIIGAQSTMYPDLVVLTGLRSGAEQLAARAASDAGVPYVAVLPYPDPASGLSAGARSAFEEGLAGASDSVTLESTRPSDGDGRRGALARRDGWLRSVCAGAVVVTDGRDPEAELLLRRFTESLGDDVWTLDVEAT